MSLVTDERAAPEGEGMPRPDAVDVGRVQRDIEQRLIRLQQQENSLWVFAVALLLGSLFAAFANGFLAIMSVASQEESLPDVKPAWWSDESEGEYSEDPVDGYPYDE